MQTSRSRVERLSGRNTWAPAQLRSSALRLLGEALCSAGRAASDSLAAVRRALLDQRLDLALRQLDRAWRTVPEAAMLAPLYARLLLLEGRDYYAALGLLKRGLALGPSPDDAALVALALLHLERHHDARRELEAALHRYCVVPGGILCHVASEIARHPAIVAPGWVGRGPRLELLGELSASEHPAALELAIGDGTSVTQLLRALAGRDARHSFRFASPSPRLDSPLVVTVRGLELLGSGLHVPEHFALDGRVTQLGSMLRGWARLGWLPTRRLELRIEDENGRRGTTRTAPADLPPFSFNLRRFAVRGGCISVTARLPDGTWTALPDSPLLLERLVRGSPRSARLKAWCRVPARRRGPTVRPAAVTDVIIPVYRGREQTLACIAAVQRTVGADARIVVVDDASEDFELAAALDALAATGSITLLRNAANLGFVASVNRALAFHPAHDAVLLNSDTQVFDDWLPRLKAVAYSGAAVGTVTPLSNAGSIASYPYAAGAEASPGYAEALHALARSTHPGRSVEIPVGVGFCLYVRRDCLEDVGELDAALFGKGYGEEVDFCLRARRRGWSHRLAADVYVYHAGAVSFGSRRAALLDRSQRLLNLRYPGYAAFIASFERQDPVQAIRRRLDEHQLSAFQGRFVLLVTLALKGGVERFVAARCAEIRAQGLHPLLLRPASAGDVRHCELWTDALELPNLRFEIPRDLATLAALLRVLRLEAIEVQHFLHLDARVIEVVRTLALPYEVFVHDYAWFCPRITLLTGSGRYCGEPQVEVCERCVRRNGSGLGEAIRVKDLRRRSDIWLRGARRVIAPSGDTAARMRRHFEGLPVEVRPLALLAPSPAAPPRAPERRSVRVALLGAIGDHKGYKVLRACARDARERRLPLEFVVIGYTRDDRRLLATGKVFVTGRYTESEAPHLLEREQPDVIWLPSVWPETWCYTLDYALSSGLPLVGFAIGAIAERLSAAGAGVLLPLDLAPRAINERLLSFGRRRRAG